MDQNAPGIRVSVILIPDRILEEADAHRWSVEALEGIRAQTMASWELIAVTDSDAPPPPLPPQTGHATTLAEAARLARGECVALIATADTWLAEKLTQQLRILAQHPQAAMVIGRPLMWRSWDDSAPDAADQDHHCELGGEVDGVVEPPVLFAQALAGQYQTAEVSDALVRRAPFLHAVERVPETGDPIVVARAALALIQLEEKIFFSSQTWARIRISDEQRDARIRRARTAQHVAVLKGLAGPVLAQGDPDLVSMISYELDKYDYSRIARLAEATGPDLRVSSVEYVGEGLSNRAYRLNDSIIFRLPKTDAAERELTREVRLLLRLQPLLRTPIPRPVIVGQAHRTPDTRLRRILRRSFRWLRPSSRKSGLAAGAARAYVGYPEIRGNFLYPEVIAADKDLRSRIAKSLGQFLTEIHSIDLLVVAGIKLPKRSVCRDLAFVDAALSGRLSAEQSRSVRDLLDQVERDGRGAERDVLLHGDLGWDHVLVDPSGSLAGIIDFGGACVGEAAQDFKELCRKYGRTFLEEVLEHYALDRRPGFSRRIRFLMLCEAASALASSGSTGEIQRGVQLLQDTISALER